MTFTIGDKTPTIVGAAGDGRFYSLDLQAGRPAVLVALGSMAADAATEVLDQIAAAEPGLRAAGADIVALAPIGAPISADPGLRDRVIFTAEAGGLDSLRLDDAPAAIVIDRAGRIVHLGPILAETDLVAIYHTFAQRLASEPARRTAASAPVLIIPNLVPPEFCEAVIAWFEQSPHTAGVMASYGNGQAQAKLDESKKKRRDTELAPGSPLHEAVMAVIAGRAVPEIKRAFQKDITFADRILVARYDDTGGYFRRHRDDAAPQTAFRQFALSLNLNTQDYEGGELLFPEYDDHRYSPPAGAAIVFSASLLHEAAPVTKGSRYVLLSFLCGAS